MTDVLSSYFMQACCIHKKKHQNLVQVGIIFREERMLHKKITDAVHLSFCMDFLVFIFFLEESCKSFLIKWYSQVLHYIICHLMYKGYIIFDIWNIWSRVIYWTRKKTPFIQSQIEHWRRRGKKLTLKILLDLEAKVR